MVSEFLIAVLIVASSTVVAGVIIFTLRRLLAKAQLRREIHESISLVIKGPVTAAVIGFGLILAANYVYSLSPEAVPYFIKPANLTLLVELGVLAVTVRTAGAVIKRLIPSLTNIKGADRLLVYGIYTLGLVALSYIVLSSPISPSVTANVWSTINFLTGLFATYLVAYIVNIVIRRYAAGIERRNQQLQTAVTLGRRLILAVIALIGVSATTFSSFPTAGGVIASLFIAAGFSSIVIGLAAQSSLSNMFAGMVLAASQPFKIGDAVLFKNEWCWVEDMRLNFTILKTWDNRRLVVPNQLFLGDHLINYDLNDSSKLCIVYIQIPYEADVDRAIEIMKNEARKHSDFLPAGNLPVVHVMEYNESGVSLRLLSNAKDQPTNFQMSKDLLYTVRKEFQKNGIEIAYPRRELILKSEVGYALLDAARIKDVSRGQHNKEADERS